MTLSIAIHQVSLSLILLYFIRKFLFNLELIILLTNYADSKIVISYKVTVKYSEAMLH